MLTRRQLLIYSGSMLLMPPALHAGYARPVSVLEAPFQTIGRLYADLFPGNAFIPSPAQLNATQYLGGVLKDPCIPESDKDFIRNGAAWLNEEAVAMFGKPYYRLAPQQRQDVLASVSQKVWGDNWLWTIFSYLFESLLGDPVYGANTNRAGWHWLGHEPGYPRPKAPFYEAL